MCHASRPEKALVAGNRAVDELVHHHEIAGCHFLAEAADGRDRDDIRNAQPFERVDVGAVGHIGGRVHMAAPVAGQKGHRHAPKTPRQDRVGGRTPRRFDLLPAGVLQPVDLVDARATNDAKNSISHIRPPLRDQSSGRASSNRFSIVV
jgi:hypothetical protein